MATAEALLAKYGIREPREKIVRRKAFDLTRRSASLDLSDVIGAMGRQGVLQLTYDVAVEESARQLRLHNNPVNEARVDGRLATPLLQMKRNLIVSYGEGPNLRPLLARVEQIVEATLGTAYGWIAPDGEQALARALNGTGPLYLNGKERLLLVAASEEAGRRAASANVFYKAGLSFPPRPGEEFRPRRRGFVADASRRARAVLAPEFHVTAVLSKGGKSSGHPSVFGLLRGEVREAFAPGAWYFVLTRSKK